MTLLKLFLKKAFETTDTRISSCHLFLFETAEESEVQPFRTACEMSDYLHMHNKLLI